MFHTFVQCVLFCVTVYFCRWWQTGRVWKLLSRLPGPRCFPLIGALYIIPGRDTSRYLSTLIGLTGAYGSPYCIWLGPVPVVIVSSAEHARTILTSPATVDKASFYRFTPLQGIFSLPAHKWRAHRKMIQPSFKQSILRSFIPLFEQKAANMILFEIVTIRAVNIFLHPQWLYRWTSVYRKETKALEEFCQPSKTILARKTTSEPSSTESTNRFSLIEHLQSSALGSEAIEQELNTIIFAGNETSAMTVANTILLLAMHPHVQEKMLSEIRVHCGAEVENIEYETLKRLTYMEMVLKESLRLLPIAAVIGRRTTAELDLGQYRLPADIDVVIDIFDIHRNREYWGTDADRFRPERFEGLQYDPYALLPFSAGSRNCIGLRYAWISMKIMLLKVVGRYRIETDLKLEELAMKIALTMKISNGHMVRLRRRQ
uniref:Cytochrome P450 n=1 Tax=Anopheles christyi TaxID=43041 RepID=A0A182JYD5_9DIPT